MASVTATAAALEAEGIPVLLRPIENHDHDYYGRSAEVNLAAWNFLKTHKLDSDPRFKAYDPR